MEENSIQEEKIIEKREKKLISWLKNNPDKVFFGILVLGILIRLYYFFLTADQPLWWDESDYMAYAKNLAGFNVNWVVSPQHNSLFPYLASIFFRIGLSEVVIKFFLVLLPSIVLIYLIYKICILMYKDNKIALISSFLMVTFWNILFNSTRFHIEALALFFAFLAIYVFFQGYEHRKKIFGKINPHWAIPLTVFFVALTYAVRRGYFIFGIFFLFYMLFTRSFKELIKDKYNWIALGIVIILILIVENFIFISALGNVAGSYYNTEGTISLDSLKIFGVYFNNMQNPTFGILLYLFWIGFVAIAFKLVLVIGYFKRDEGPSNLKSDLFNCLSIVFTLAFFIFILKINFSEGAGYDPRWFFPLLLSSFIFISKGAIFITDFLKKYNKYLSLAVLVFLIGFGGYYQLQYTDTVIKSKAQSFNGLKQAGLFLKEISQEEGIIISVPAPQTSYYAERTVLNPGDLAAKSNRTSTLENFFLDLEENPNIRYIIVSFSEPNHPDWMRKEREEYAQNPQTGQVVLAKWEIPFMDTKIDFINNQQNIRREKSYGNITFRLLDIKEDVFIYEIIRN